MKDVTIEQWIEELESGRWIPAYGVLAEFNRDEHGQLNKLAGLSDNRRCCLGVLTEMVCETQAERLSVAWADGYPPVSVLRHVPWLVQPFMNRTDTYEDPDAVIDMIDHHDYDADTVLGMYAQANDIQFPQGGNTPENDRPNYFTPVIEQIKAWYGIS
jgi:hypothetical protein